jgi:cobalt-zinc-cadmium efflux system outer membrane protein
MPMPSRSPRAAAAGWSARALRAAAAALLLAPAARAASEAGGAPAAGAPTDPVLAELIAQSLSARPELRQAEATVRAERERVPQAGALPDPVLSLGIQNDGFQEITVGKMETSYYQVMLSQGLPWPGKRGLRTDVARLAADEAGAALSRARLTTEADVRRAYLDLVLSRDRLDILKRLESIWQSSAGIARARYEAGEGPQSDVLRAQLELNRIRQRRLALEAAEIGAVQTLNRFRGRPIDEPIATTATVRTIPLPEPVSPEAAVDDALARSPELAQARLGTARAEKSAALARRDRYPDLSVDVGIMPRGDLEPMWLAGVSIGLPVWSYRKQNRAVAEGRARAEAGARGQDAIEQILRLRVAERRTAYASLLETIRLFREGLLVQSRATADSTLAQYRVGKVTFASVLEANAGYVNDEESFLGAVADAQRIAIAAAEVSLERSGGPSAGAMGGASVPGAGAVAGAGMGGAAPAARGTEASGAASTASGM